MAIIKQTTAYNRAFLLVASSDHITGLTGVTTNTIVVQGYKNAAPATTLTAVVTELGNGYYNAALKTSDTSVLGDLAFHISAPSADPTDFIDQVAANILGDTLPANVTQVSGAAVNAASAQLGVNVVQWNSQTALTDGNNLPKVDVEDWKASAVPSFPSFPTNFSSLSIDSNGNVSTTSNIKKNVALNNFSFVMTDSTTNAPKTGLTVTATRALDGGAFSACANSVTEIANGFYKINLAASDLNGNIVALRFTATGANDQDITIVTQP